MKTFDQLKRFSTENVFVEEYVQLATICIEQPMCKFELMTYSKHKTSGHTTSRSDTISFKKKLAIVITI